LKTTVTLRNGLYKRCFSFVFVLVTSGLSIYGQNLPYQVFPATYGSKPDIVSPCVINDTMEVILVETKNLQYGIVPVTMENGDPLVYSYKLGTMMGKDQQLHIDEGDFRSLAKTGLHSDVELENKKMITGIPIDVINCTARPNAYSVSGFVAEDEDIISVLKGDNHLVRSMGLTHPQMAKPLFHIWNLILKEIELGNWKGRFYDNIKHVFYNGNLLSFNVSGSKGWQISIFFDEVQGRYNIHINRKLSVQEEKYLEERYSHLSNDEMTTLVSRLTNLLFSEMNPFYIMLYGFYEGHTEYYRCDPVAIAFIFGLKSIEEIGNTFGSDLLNTFTRHYNSGSLPQ
jgi:hypothetical protein